MGEIKVMVDAGKANAGPPLGPSLAPTGVNIGEVVAKINEKTMSFEGMKVPVTVTINNDKSFDISVGLPPTSALIKKESKAQKGAGNPKTDVMGNLTISQVLKIAEMKNDSITSYTKKKMVKEIMGVCNSMGVTIEGMRGKDAQKEVDAGKWDSELKE